MDTLSSPLSSRFILTAREVLFMNQAAKDR